MPMTHRHLIGTAFAIILAAGAALPAQAQATGAIPVATAPADASGDARAPYAWSDLCRRSPAECRVDLREADRVEMTPKL